MPMFNTEFIRQQFPAFSEASLAGFAHFENAGGSYTCGAVIDRLVRYYRETKVQPYYDFPASTRAGREMDEARSRMAAWLNVATEEVHFGPSTSQNTYVIAQALRQHLKPGDEIVVTNQDHEANIGAWRRLESEGLVIREWTVDPDSGELDPDDLDTWLGPKTRAVAFTHCSNFVASINPVRELSERIHAAGAIAIVDGVSYCPHGLPDLKELGADIYLFSLYKVYGPHLGVMYMSKRLNAELPNQGHYFNAGNPTARFTPAGPDHAQIAAANGVVDYFETVHQHHFNCDVSPSEQARAVKALLREQESSLLQPALDYMDQHPKIRLIGRRQAAARAPTIGFTVDGWDSFELASRLSRDYKLGVGAGNYYAVRLLEALNIDPGKGALRASFVHYTSEDEVSRLLSALDTLI
ncbi:MAG TPA: aminotransferase class V-fold PLP-dependent enzyme [Xanthomonadales bacterium]|nr:aminotransferase class V-fold PLP-dependent enzyme [Xanthomonadales bacterium]